MKRFAALFVIALGSIACAADQKYTFSIGGQPAGTGVLTYSKLPDGASKFTVDLKIDIGGQSAGHRQEDVYDKNAKPILSTMIDEQGANKIEEKGVYGIASLTHSTTTNGKLTSKLVKYPLGKSIAKPSQLWLFSTHPEPKTTSSEIEYDVKSGKWVGHKRIVVGPSQIEIGGKKIRAIELDDKDLVDGSVVKSWVDSQGMPYRVDFESSGQPMRLERVMS